MALISLRQLLDHAANQGSKIKKVYSLEEMHHRYAESS